jgi:diadenosine tetraphosphate (Ap4A) HIT family hydrolase
MCPIRAERILRRTAAGVVAVPEQSVRPGHIMVVSTQHARSFSDLSQLDADAFMALVGATARAAEGASGAERYYVIRIGDTSPHLHFHLVPRAEGEPSLAPYVFGEAGWSAQVRPDATPPSHVFDPTFSRDLRTDEIRTPVRQDTKRWPAWLRLFRR